MYSPTSIINLTLFLLRPKLIYYGLTSFQSSLYLPASLSVKNTASFILPRYRKSRSTSHNTKQTVLIQPILFSTSIDFVYTHLNIKTVLYQTIEFSVNTQFKCKYTD